jgi:hypothetical protein
MSVKKEFLPFDRYPKEANDSAILGAISAESELKIYKLFTEHEVQFPS